MRRPVLASIAASTVAGMMPRMPPPSIARILHTRLGLSLSLIAASFHRPNRLQIFDQSRLIFLRERRTVKMALVAVALLGDIKTEAYPLRFGRLRVETDV